MMFGNTFGFNEIGSNLEKFFMKTVGVRRVKVVIATINCEHKNTDDAAQV